MCSEWTVEAALLALVARRSDVTVLLLGKDGDRTRDVLLSRHPIMTGRLHASGYLNPQQLSLHLSACDVMLQPFRDGVSSRRTSVLTSLALGVPIVTTAGALTEDFWSRSAAVVLARVGDIAQMTAAVAALLDDAIERGRMALATRTLYRSRFAVEHAVRASERGADPPVPPLTVACVAPPANGGLARRVIEVVHLARGADGVVRIFSAVNRAPRCRGCGMVGARDGRNANRCR